MKNVRADQRGSYKCKAENKLGVGHSNAVNLKVRCECNSSSSIDDGDTPKAALNLFSFSGRITRV